LTKLLFCDKIKEKEGGEKMKELDVLRQKMLDYRARHNISQYKLAELCKLTPQTVCNVENGIQEPSKLTKQKILNVIEGEN
jgi:DNA-binding XRE family transcriptional regulator